jgi:ribose transport system permease protein
MNGAEKGSSAPPERTDPVQPTKSISDRFRSILSGASVSGNAQVVALAVIDLLFALFLSLMSRTFLTSANLIAVGVAMASNVLAAMGSTLVLLSGGFDLSIGSTYGLAGVIMAYALLRGIPVPLAMLVGLLVGVVIGLINGLMITKLEINPFIATMGTMTVGRGFVHVLTRGYSVSGLPESFMRLIHATIFGLPPSLVFMIVAFIITDFLLRYWRPARQLYYIGGSASSARLVGVNVTRVQIAAYLISGILAALGGLLFTTRTGAAHQMAGVGLEMKAMVAPFLGGVGFGGQGSALGSFLGATLLALVFNAIQLLDIAVLWQDVVTGAFLIGAALIGMAGIRRAAKR